MIKIDNKTKYIIIGGMIFVLCILILEFINLNSCTDNLGCLSLAFLLLSPGILISNFILKSNSAVLEGIVNFVFYFVLGGFLGWLIYYFKNKKKKK